jgi:hypothetical protein
MRPRVPDGYYSIKGSDIDEHAPPDTALPTAFEKMYMTSFALGGRYKIALIEDDEEGVEGSSEFQSRA